MKRTAFGFAAALALALPVLAFSPTSGLKPGDMTSAFEPIHVAGPDKGTETCPVCKYGSRPAVQVWHNGDAAQNVVDLANHLDKKVAASKNEFKAFTVGIADTEAQRDAVVKIGGMIEGGHVGVTYLASSDPALKAYKINTDSSVKNTVIVYKDRKVVATMVNVKADKAGLKALDAALAKVEN